MFIGSIEKEISFGRGPDKKKRKRRDNTKTAALAGGTAVVGGAYGGLRSLAKDAQDFEGKYESNPKGFEDRLNNDPKFAKDTQKLRQAEARYEGANKLRATKQKLKAGEINPQGAKKAMDRMTAKYGQGLDNIASIEKQLGRAKDSRASKAFAQDVNKKRLAKYAIAGVAAGGLYGYAVGKSRQKAKEKRERVFVKR